MFRLGPDHAFNGERADRRRALLLAATAGCAQVYSAKPTFGFVVDAQTRQPVEGAVVVAQWDLEYGLEGGAAYAWVVMETVTDSQGRFDFAGWGPKKVPHFLPGEAHSAGSPVLQLCPGIPARLAVRILRHSAVVPRVQEGLRASNRHRGGQERFPLRPSVAREVAGRLPRGAGDAEAAMWHDGARGPRKTGAMT